MSTCKEIRRYDLLPSAEDSTSEDQAKNIAEEPFSTAPESVQDASHEQLEDNVKAEPEPEDNHLLDLQSSSPDSVPEATQMNNVEHEDIKFLVDAEVPENYVAYMHRIQKPLPPVTWANWYRELKYLNIFVLTASPTIGLIGAIFTPLRWQTFLFSIIWYFVTGLGITAGYHRLWSHKSYNASRVLQYYLAICGAGALEGSIRKWAKDHRAHHRYVDTDLDPYSAHRGLLWSHIGWMFVKPRRQPGIVDITDLIKNDVVQWQDHNYTSLALLVAFVIPAVIPWILWGDGIGGFIYAGVLRTCFVHHSTFCVNSLAHYLGEAPFGDNHSSRDHPFTALVTIGEGYHNFHHQFPNDYRCSIKWYQYDPTKWFIWICSKVGLASYLKVFPDNEVRKSHFTMNLKKLLQTQENIQWPSPSNNLPEISWESFQIKSKDRKLILISGFIHDVSDFLSIHPGGEDYLINMIGKDATVAFNGGVHAHTDPAHGSLAMKRVGVLIGGHPHALKDKFIQPKQQLKICKVE